MWIGRDGPGEGASVASSILRRDFIKQAVSLGATTGLALLVGQLPGSEQGNEASKGQEPSDGGDASSGPEDADAGGAPETDSGAESDAGAEDDAEPAVLQYGAEGDAVLALQRRLGELGYWCGTPDAHYGGLTASAVTALQKVAGLVRDGIAGPATSRALAAGARPSASTRSGHVIEIHRDSQVLLVVDSGRVSMTLATCTGSEIPYESEGRTWSARTTPGSYHVYFSKEGWDHGPLGDLWRPMFFNGGIAVHGSTSVPPYPASHGCCRLTIPAMDMIIERRLIKIGTAVVVY